MDLYAGTPELTFLFGVVAAGGGVVLLWVVIRSAVLSALRRHERDSRR